MEQIPAIPKLVLRAPLSGHLMPIERVPDPVFAQKMVGDGISIDPLNQCLAAPCDGEVVQLHSGGHAVTLATTGGIEVVRRPCGVFYGVVGDCIRRWGTFRNGHLRLAVARLNALARSEYWGGSGAGGAVAEAARQDNCLACRGGYSMPRHSLMAVVFVMSLAGCAAMEAPGRGAMPGAPPETFAHRVATSEVVLLWNCGEPEPGRLRLEGVAQNPWQAQPIGNLEFDLVGVNAQDRTTAETAGTARDLQLYTNESTPFQLDLQTTGTEVRFDLYYHYRFYDEFEMGALIAGPPLAGPHLPANQNHLVRDVCSPTQHRAG